jgi:hypothetical protein
VAGLQPGMENRSDIAVSHTSSACGSAPLLGHAAVYAASHADPTGRAKCKDRASHLRECLRRSNRTSREARHPDLAVAHGHRAEELIHELDHQLQGAVTAGLYMQFGVIRPGVGVSDSANAQRPGRRIQNFGDDSLTEPPLEPRERAVKVKPGKS